MSMRISEIFHSIQGESTLSGLRFGFIRTSGCNLRCRYCDTAYAQGEDGRDMDVEEILRCLEPFGVQYALLTGGEPLLQAESPVLLQALRGADYFTSVETNGEVPIASVKDLARIIMDIKTPGSGMCREGFRENLPHLKETDEVKFVLTDASDYAWARDWVRSGKIATGEILMSVARTTEGTSALSTRWLAEKIIEDRLPVRLQLQLHKIIWSPETRGV